MHLLQTLRNALRELSGRKEVHLVKVPTIPDEVPPVAVVEPPPETVIPVVPTYDLRILKDFFEDNETLINRYIIKKLAVAIKNDDDAAILFFIPVTGETAKVVREYYESTLHNIIAHFVKVEEYERIKKCQKLLIKHSVNEVLRRSR